MAQSEFPKPSHVVYPGKYGEEDGRSGQLTSAPKKENHLMVVVIGNFPKQV